MKIERISYSYGVKLSHSYQSVDVSTGVDIALDEGDDPRQVLAEIRPRIRAGVEKEARAALRGLFAPVQSAALAPAPASTGTAPAATSESAPGRWGVQARYTNQGGK